MRVQNAVVAGLLCLFTLGASADITRVSPSSFSPSGEDYITIYGSDLLGTVGTQIVFDDQFTVEEPNFASQTEILSWVPVGVLLVEGQHSVKVLSIDAAGVRVHGPAFFTVALPPPSGAPTVVVPDGGYSVEAESSQGATVDLPVSAFSADGDPLPVTCLPASGSVFPLGLTSVQCSATDAGGTTQNGFVLFVTDTTAPVITVPADIVTDNPVVHFTATAVDQIDGPLTVSCNPPSGSTFVSGVTTVRCIASDTRFNLAEGLFTVRVTGGPPILTLPDDIVEEATSANGAVVSYQATSEDGTVSCSPASGATFPLGATTVNCTATSSGGQTSGSFTVTVVDTTGPVLSTPFELRVDAESAAGATATWVATAFDLVDGDRPVTCAPPSGSFFAFGTTPVFCSAADTRNNSETVIFDVIVEDLSAPQFTSVVATPGALWPPNHQMVAVTVAAVAVDAVDPAPQIQILNVRSNQPVNGTGDGDMAPDWEITGPLTLNLRAERSQGKERVYTIIVQATDSSGNVSTSSTTVRVADTTPKRRAVR
jgi:hypothetical protein